MKLASSIQASLLQSSTFSDLKLQRKGGNPISGLVYFRRILVNKKNRVDSDSWYLSIFGFTYMGKSIWSILTIFKPLWPWQFWRLKWDLSISSVVWILRFSGFCQCWRFYCISWFCRFSFWFGDLVNFSIRFDDVIDWLTPSILSILSILTILLFSDSVDSVDFPMVPI